MTEALEGKRYWKVGDRRHVWMVDAVEPASGARGAFAILVSDDSRASEDVDLTRLLNPELYTPVPEHAYDLDQPEAPDEGE